MHACFAGDERRLGVELASDWALGTNLGPQCYPQVRDEARYRANKPKVIVGADEPPTLPAAREQLCCWLQCDDCRRWRLVERKSFPSVDPAGFARAAGDSDDHAASVSWAEWFDKAPARFDVTRAAASCALQSPLASVA